MPCAESARLSSLPPIGIIAYSDFYDVPDRRVWGDYWLKENLTREFLGLGYPVDNTHPEIVLHLFGEPLGKIPAVKRHSILWIHSHPDRITHEILSMYGKIYCISKYFTEKIVRAGFNAGTLMIPTNMTAVNAGKRYDIVFVGNTKQNKVRKVISDMGQVPYNVRIWGWGWKGLVPESWYGGEYYDNRRLNDLYASAKVVLNDHHEDMRREGFINPRILDVLASGGFVISDSVRGMEEFLGDSVPVYERSEELRSLLEKYLKDEAGRAALSKRGRALATKFTFRDACSEIIRHIETVSGKLSL